MKEQPTFTPKDMAPMLATHGSVERLTSTVWAFEGKWDGYRLLVDADHGALELRSRSGRDVTREYPQLEALAADLADHHVVLDGEVVALDESRRAELRGDAEPRAPAPTSNSGRSTSCRWMADRCCAPSTPTAAASSRRWPTAAD